MWDYSRFCSINAFTVSPIRPPKINATLRLYEEVRAVGEEPLRLDTFHSCNVMPFLSLVCRIWFHRAWEKEEEWRDSSVVQCGIFFSKSTAASCESTRAHSWVLRTETVRAFKTLNPGSNLSDVKLQKTGIESIVTILERLLLAVFVRSDSYISSDFRSLLIS